MSEADEPILLLTKDGRFTEEGSADFKRLREQLSGRREARLLLFVHGGLVPRKAAMAQARSLDDPTGWSGLGNHGWERAYVIWHSGLGETITINRDELAKDPLLQRLLFLVIKWVSGRLGLKAIVTALRDERDLPKVLAELEGLEAPPPAAIDELIAADPDERWRIEAPDDLGDAAALDTDLADLIASDPTFRDIAGSKGRRIDQRVWDNLDEEVQSRIEVATGLGQDGATRSGTSLGAGGLVLVVRAVLAGYRVLKRFKNKRDHGIACTIVEEVLRAFYLAKTGARAWSLMKDDLHDHFEKHGAGTALLNLAADLAHDGRPVRILLVGHSAGSVFAGAFSVAARRLPANVKLDVALLAPAIRLDAAADAFMHSPNRLDGFRIFTMSDALECSDALDNTDFGKFYTRSLLYLISGVLERRERRSYADAPLLGLERHLAPLVPLNETEQAARDAVAGLLAAGPERLVLSPDREGEGTRTEAQSHGTFDDDLTTRASIYEIARGELASDTRKDG